jgi:hypothetical protein
MENPLLPQQEKAAPGVAQGRLCFAALRDLEW